jgi:hypothetical protein
MSLSDMIGSAFLLFDDVPAQNASKNSKQEKAHQFMHDVLSITAGETQFGKDDIIELAGRIIEMRDIYLDIVDLDTQKAKKETDRLTVGFLHNAFDALQRISSLDFRTLDDECAKGFLADKVKPKRITKVPAAPLKKMKLKNF